MTSVVSKAHCFFDAARDIGTTLQAVGSFCFGRETAGGEKRTLPEGRTCLPTVTKHATARAGDSHGEGKGLAELLWELLRQSRLPRENPLGSFNGNSSDELRKETAAAAEALESRKVEGRRPSVATPAGRSIGARIQASRQRASAANSGLQIAPSTNAGVSSSSNGDVDTIADTPGQDLAEGNAEASRYSEPGGPWKGALIRRRWPIQHKEPESTVADPLQNAA